MAGNIIKRLLSESDDGTTISVSTSGKPLTLVRVPHAIVATSDASPKTITRRNKTIEKVRDLVSCGDSSSQLQEEIKHLSKSERQDLLHKAGFTLDIPAEQGLAMKADLGIPWTKLRVIRRWLQQWGISLSSEKRQRVVAKTLLGDNLDAEMVPLTHTFKKGGGEEVRASVYCYIPNLQKKLFDMIDDKDKYVK